METLAFSLVLYLFAWALVSVEVMDADDFYPEGPITYCYILFWIFLPFVFTYSCLRKTPRLMLKIYKFTIQVHKNSFPPKKTTNTFSNNLKELYDSMPETNDDIYDRLRGIHKTKRPIPEILEELDEAVEERGNND